MSATFAEIYDLESAVETAVQTIFVAAELAAGTTEEQSEEFQKTRPRVEIQCVLGAATGHLQAMTSGELRHDAFTASLTLYAISAAGPAGATLHKVYRAQVRNLADRLIYTLPAELTWHELNECVPAGATPMRAEDNSHIMTQLTYTLHLSVKAAAWPADA